MNGSNLFSFWKQWPFGHEVGSHKWFFIVISMIPVYAIVCIWNLIKEIVDRRNVENTGIVTYMEYQTFPRTFWLCVPCLENHSQYSRERVSVLFVVNCTHAIEQVDCAGCIRWNVHSVPRLSLNWWISHFL